MFFLLQWHSIQLLLAWSLSLTSHSELQHQVPLLSVAPPTCGICALTQAATNRLHPVSRGQNVGRRQVCSHDLNSYTCGTCRLRSKETCWSTCFIGMSHLAGDMGRLQRGAGCICSWRSPWWPYLLGELQLPGEGCG